VNRAVILQHQPYALAAAESPRQWVRDACSYAGGYAGEGVSRYTRQEVAQRAGVDPDYVDRLVELGILTPAAGDAFSPGDVLRARWLQSLERAGVPLEGLAAAVRDGALSFSFMDVTAFDRFAGLSGTTF
jgi:hypothetical protein